jgi:hypothetical protein
MIAKVLQSFGVDRAAIIRIAGCPARTNRTTMFSEERNKC